MKVFQRWSRIKMNERVFTSGSEKAEALNKHFAITNVVQVLRRLCPSFPHQNLKLQIQIDTPEGVHGRDRLAALNSWKAFGVYNNLPMDFEGMPAWLRLYNCKHPFHIFDPLLSCGQNYEQRKKERISPLFKRENDRSAPSSYGPITVLPALSKIPESLFHSQLLHNCHIESCLPDEQFGFLPKRSTVWQLLFFLAKCVNSF